MIPEAFFRKRLYRALLIMMFAIFACDKNDLKQVEELSKAKTIPVEVSTGIDVIYTDSALLKARLKAPEMRRYLSEEDPKIEMPKGVYVEFYDKAGAVNSRLRGDYGIRFLSKNLTKITGDVEVINLKGDTMNTEELWWDETKEKVYSQKFVKVKTKDEIILAEGFESDVTFSKYTFYKIKGVIAVKD
ncbi:MAG: LPS export ABC transporter periplasmic protein LptC [Sphingobacteriales bacterium]|nr:MAG: LPS export ABC transporter periplasmic protein LptC [Sphingobacteriales bacterium]